MSAAGGISHVFLVLLVITVFTLVVPVTVGIYVYRDAKRRGMNALLWAVLAAVVPSLIGLIVYLLVRGNYSNMRCPRCSAPVNDQYVVCPRCGVKLRPSCPNCGTATEPGWVVCPRCAQPLPPDQGDVVRPVRPKDKALWKIILLLILIPAVLIAVLLVSFSAYGVSGSSYMSTTVVPAEMYLMEMQNPHISTWLASCDDENKAYALKHEGEEDRNGLDTVTYCVYVPKAVEMTDYSADLDSGLFRDTIELKIPYAEGEGEDVLFLIHCGSRDETGLRVFYSGVKMDCDVTEIEDELSPEAADNSLRELIEEMVP
ncbi:MAG: zinc ribbon domain-containing protein [Lachnospiraceae bacterium]|nr:zinc ribbon domain-containing protein [Lachnospiraceae bacterium]